MSAPGAWAQVPSLNGAATAGLVQPFSFGLRVFDLLIIHERVVDPRRRTTRELLDEKTPFRHESGGRGGSHGEKQGVGGGLAIYVDDELFTHLLDLRDPAAPQEEVRVAWEIVKSLGLRTRGVTVVACPTCGRLDVDNFVEIVTEIERRLAHVESHCTFQSWAAQSTVRVKLTIRNSV